MTIPGVIERLLPRPGGPAWADWMHDHPGQVEYWETRAIIKPRLILVHTNGAQGEGRAGAAYNWAMSSPNNTKPHYQVDRDGSAVQFLPSNRMGIANYKAAPFSIAIETADAGWGPGKLGGLCGFTELQAETVAQIIAWESEEWGIPIAWPYTWDGTGVAAHTEPFDFPYWTNSKGKPCPGLQKKLELREIVMPRAQMIRLKNRQPPVKPVEIPPPMEEDEMTIRLLTLPVEESYASFFAMCTYDGRALRCEWTGPGNDEKVNARLAAHTAGGMTVMKLTGGIGSLINTSLDGPLPVNDPKHVWTGDEFANSEEIRARNRNTDVGSVAVIGQLHDEIARIKGGLAQAAGQ